MAKSWQEIERGLKGQRAGQRILLQRAGIAMVKFRYKGEHISAELLDATGIPMGGVTASQADNLRHIAASQLDANWAVPRCGSARPASWSGSWTAT